MPRSVSIEGCTELPCRLIKGKDAIVEVQFTTTQATETLTPKVITKLAGLSIPYNLPEEQRNACNHLTDTKCPLEPSEDATYVLTMPVLEFYPLINIEIQLEMLGDQNETIFCFKVDCRVVDV